MGEINLDDNEQLTFKSKSGKNYDFTRKNWGYYATQSINHRLKNNGFRTALVINKFNRLYVMVVEKNLLNNFLDYCESEEQKILIWLDDYKDVKRTFKI